MGQGAELAQPPRQKLIQVDVDEEILGQNKPVEIAILSDAKVFLHELAEALEARKGTMPLENRRKAMSSFGEAMVKQRGKLDKSLKDLDDPMVTAHVAVACQEFFEDDAVFVSDGGNTTVWGMFFHQARTPNSMLSTTKFGMLGAGVAQALGAAVARPDKQVYCIIGDGAMGFNQQELETAVRNKLKVIYLVCSDKQWGMVKMTQQFVFRPWKTVIKKSLDPGETINADLEEIAFDKLAQSMGAHGERVSKPDQLRPALERCVASGKPAVIHVDVDPVKHMWAPHLMTFKKMHQEPAGK